MKLNDPSDLLIEIGVEELPPKSLEMLIKGFRDNIVEGLEQARLTFDKNTKNPVEHFVTPRRLALRIKNLSASQPAQTVSKKGPMVAVAFDSTGKPTPAALGFAASCQTTVDALARQKTDKGDCLVFEQTLPGQSVKTLIPKIIQDALHALPLPKRMRWGDQKESFVRPVHWIVLLFGKEVIPFECFGIPAGRITRGHRFFPPQEISLREPLDYAPGGFSDQLGGKAMVYPNFETRSKVTRDRLAEIAKQEKAKNDFDLELLEEVIGLVEWPVVLLGKFDDQFLALPKEVLISSMKTHQKCFPLMDDAQGKLLAKFLIVSNIESSDPRTVIQGNERVMHARLQDAVFFYRVDKETPLSARQEDLKKVVFQQGLGSLWDKSNRIKELSKFILSQIPQDWFKKPEEIPTQDDCEQAALLCKTDLLTLMVGEFPELQGVMGHYYALQDGESKKIAQAIENHYLPRFADDRLPPPDDVLGLLLALSDRIDTLVGIFGLGKHPTGDRDPFALRRQALAILRIIIRKDLDLDLKQLFEKSEKLYGNLLNTDTPIIQSLLDFCFERLRGFLCQNPAEECPVRVFEAVLAKRPTKFLDFYHRIEAVKAFKTLPEAESLSMANKRVHNILSKSEIPIPPGTLFENNWLKEDAEKALAKAILDKEQAILPLLKSSQYTEALKSLAALKAPIDQFFDSVMVMVEDQNLRNNRLKLLNRLRTLFLEIADISLL